MKLFAMVPYLKVNSTKTKYVSHSFARGCNWAKLCTYWMVNLFILAANMALGISLAAVYVVKAGVTWAQSRKAETVDA